VFQRKLYRAAKQSRNRRFHALYDKVHRPDILWRAWKEVARNRGAAGVDEISIKAINEQGVTAFLNELREELATERYRPLPVRRVRVVQAATKLVVEPRNHVHRRRRGDRCHRNQRRPIRPHHPKSGLAGKRDVSELSVSN
jgi:hypothetical protein